MYRRAVGSAAPILLILLASLTLGVGRAAAVSFAPKADFATGTGP